MRPLAALVLTLGLLAALSVAALSSGHRHRIVGSRTRSGIAIAARPRRAHARRRGLKSTLTPLDRREERAIDRVLRYTSFVVAGSGRRREVALTFDDGPGPYTRAILAILRRKHVPATFFLVGQQLDYFAPQLRDELRQRVAVGDHTENHAWLVRLSAAGQAGQIDDDALRIRHDGGVFPRLFRPPYGAFNATTVRILRRARMLMVLWSVDPSDWSRPGVGAIVSNVLTHVRSGAIVLLHDGGGYRGQTVAALSAIIDGLRRRHYQLVSVPRLVLDDPPPRDQRLPGYAGA